MQYYKRIRELREDNDLTQQEIAKMLNLHLTTYQRWESGEREIPTHIIIELSKIYNVTTDYILECERENVQKSEQLHTITQLMKELNNAINGLFKPF